MGKPPISALLCAGLCCDSTWSRHSADVTLGVSLDLSQRKPVCWSFVRMSGFEPSTLNLLVQVARERRLRKVSEQAAQATAESLDADRQRQAAKAAQEATFLHLKVATLHPPATPCTPLHSRSSPLRCLLLAPPALALISSAFAVLAACVPCVCGGSL